MYETLTAYYFDADDEEPDCGRCDHCDTCCGEECGPEYGWAGYRRKELKEDGEWLLKDAPTVVGAEGTEVEK